MADKQLLTYATIGAELGITVTKFQQFVAEERRRRGNPWTPDASPKGSSQHFFTRATADALKRAWTKRRVKKTWKAKKK